MKCACMFSAVIIEIIIQRIATMPYKLNKVSTFTSSGGSIKVLNCGGKNAKKPDIHADTGNMNPRLGYEE